MSKRRPKEEILEAAQEYADDLRAGRKTAAGDSEPHQVSEGLSDEFLEHAAKADSQYDLTARKLAKALLEERASHHKTAKQFVDMKTYADCVDLKTADLNTELQDVLGDWNALTKAIEAPTNGTAVAHGARLAAIAKAMTPTDKDVYDELDTMLTAYGVLTKRVDELLDANNRELERRREAQREVDQLQSMLNILKRGLTKNDFEVAFLDAYLDNFKRLNAEAESQANYVRALETENAKLHEILERARGTKRCQLCGASYVKEEKHTEDCPVGHWDSGTI
jgi:DNA repair exonuclease SbcCD ATPase subunit